MPNGNTCDTRFVKGGYENGLGSLSPPKHRICQQGYGCKSHLRHVFSPSNIRRTPISIRGDGMGNDSLEGFFKLLKKDAEAYLQPTYFCLFEQLPPLWSAIPKRGVRA
ncbi:hypothetical protein P9112_006202 [Eukaryota sp. TZLM1-RC]